MDPVLIFRPHFGSRDMKAAVRLLHAGGISKKKTSAVSKNRLKLFYDDPTAHLLGPRG